MERLHLAKKERTNWRNSLMTYFCSFLVLAVVTTAVLSLLFLFSAVVVVSVRRLLNNVDCNYN